jgi:Protein of unknown function DUF262
MNAAFDTRQRATTYELEDLVRDAWAGKIRVPHFQRGFRWNRVDVQRLFDSIVQGYPIGSLLLWIRSAPADRIQLGALTIDAPAMQEARYVVDGQQRITSLANALNEEGAASQTFALGYDLRADQFVSRPQQEDPWVLPLPVIFDLQKLLKWFSDHPEIEGRLDQASSVTKTLRQYQIPAYNVTQDNPTVLQDVFDRMNNYGKRLSRAEVFSALFAEPEEPEADALKLDVISARVNEDLGFGVIDDDTVLKAILARRGPDVMRDIRSEFPPDGGGSSEFPSEGRDEAYAAGEVALRRAVEFVQRHAGVPHFTFLPYKHLLVVLTRLFGHYHEIDVRNTQLLRRWFWRAALVGNQGFKGSTTGATRILSARIRPNDLATSLQGMLDAVGGEWSSPKLAGFRTNTAESKIVLCTWWAQGPRSPETGERYESTQLTEVLDGSRTAGPAVAYVLDERSLPERQKRLAGNRMLVLDVTDELDRLLTRQPLHIEPAIWAETLRSHGVSEEAVGLLRDGDVGGFLAARQAMLAKILTDFLVRMCEFSLEDTPSLPDLVVEDLSDDE